MTDEVVTQMRLKEVLRYCPVTGIFSWLISPNVRIKAGAVAGAKSGNYLVIRIDGKLYRAHRLAWLYMKGVWPTHEVDHRNRNGRDNRWDNLRAATRSQNAANTGIHKHNRSGVKGVSWAKREGKWRGIVKKDRKVYEAGFFDSIVDAETAVIELRRKLHGEFAA